MRWLLPMVLAACGSQPRAGQTAVAPVAPHATPVPTSPTSAAVTPVESATAPIDTSPTPARSYDAGACKARVATMKERLETADGYLVSSRDDRLVVPGTPDPDVGKAELDVAIVRRSGHAGDFCSAWSIEVDGQGRRTLFEGRTRIVKAIALVKKRMKNGNRIGLSINTPASIDELRPLIDALSELGTLQLRVTVKSAPFVTPTAEAPAWVAARVEAIRTTAKSDDRKATAALRESLDASFTCPGVANAFKRVSKGGGGDRLSSLMVAFVPEAVSACECREVDVDALETFMTYLLVEGISKTSDGWLQFHVDPASKNEVRGASAEELARGLGALSLEQRTAGVKLVLDASKSPTAAERCQSEH